MKTMVQNVCIVLLLMVCTVSARAQITSLSSGNWSEGATWVGGVVPSDSVTDVIIASGHTVTIDNANAVCRNISFVDTLGLLSMGSSSSALSVYGNYTLATTTSSTFRSFSAWPAGAKIKFVGSGTQTLSGWSSTAGLTSFNEIVVNKTGGKVVTSASNMRFGIGDTLEVLNGTFELASTDDIEGRTYAGVASSPTIIVRKGALFTMVGSTSHIRRASNLNEETSKIGKVTVFGTAMLAAGSSNRVNFGGIDIEIGGIVEMPISRGTSTSGYFNPGTITVKSGGTFKNSLNTTFWFVNTTTPTSIVVNSGGEYECSATSTLIPSGGITQNSGSTFRFSSGSATTLPASITSYKTLILSGAGSKTLSSNITIEEALQLSGSFTTLGLSTFTLTYGTNAVLRYGASGQSTAQTTTVAEWPASGGPQNVQIYNSGGVTLHDNRTISGILTLSVGALDNNGSLDDKILTLSTGATISRARGTLTAVPSFGTTVNLQYTSSVENVTTANEMPTSHSVLNDLSVTTSQGMTLGANITVNGILTFGGSAGSITTSTNTLNLASTATMTGEAAGRYVIGNLATTCSVGIDASTFGGMGVSLASGRNDIGSVTVTRVSGAGGVVTSGKQGIARKWTIVSDNPPTNGRDVTFSWVSSDDNGKTFSAGNLAQIWKYNGSSWNSIGSAADVSASDPRSITTTTTSFSDWTISDQSSPLPVELVSFSASISGTSVLLKWNTATELNNYGFEVEKNRSQSISESWIRIGFVEGNGTTNSAKTYSFVDNISESGKYSYRLKQIDRDGKITFSNSVEAIISHTPEIFALQQNYPNPFNPSTAIAYQLPIRSAVSLKVFDALGKEVTTLVNEVKEAGNYNLKFDASKISSGIYFYQLQAGSFVEMKKMMVIK